LVGYDWVYPDMDNTMGAWKFSSDGTFNYSTTTFGGMDGESAPQVIGEGLIEKIFE